MPEYRKEIAKFLRSLPPEQQGEIFPLLERDEDFLESYLAGIVARDGGVTSDMSRIVHELRSGDPIYRKAGGVMATKRDIPLSGPGEIEWQPPGYEYYGEEIEPDPVQIPIGEQYRPIVRRRRK